jgi:hypothetical protein
LADDVEWIPASPAAVEQPVYHGVDEVARGFNQIWETWDLWEFEEHEVRDLGDSVLWLGRVHMRGGASQVEITHEAANLLEFDGEKIVRVRGFRSWDEAIEAAGA